MNKLPRFLLTSFLPLGLAAAAWAQTAPTDTDGPRRGGGPGPRHAPPVIRALDVNHDREVSSGEIASAASSLLALDLNQDGVVSREELHPVPPDRPAGAPPPPDGVGPRDRKGPREGQAPGEGRGPGDGKGPRGPRGGPSPIMMALDANSDGALSANELTNAPTSLAALDANKDGKLTVDELRPLPPTTDK